jgi:hypothetical protein
MSVDSAGPVIARNPSKIENAPPRVKIATAASSDQK